MTTFDSLANGTVTTDGTLQTLSTQTAKTRYQIFVDTTNNANGDTIEISVTAKVLTGGSEVLVYYAALADVQTILGFVSPEINSLYSTTVTIKKTAGTNHAYAWNLMEVQRSEPLTPTVAGRTLGVDGSGRVDVGSWLGQAVQAAVNGIPKVDLSYILGTALTETAGQIAAGFKKLFDVASPVFTLLSINQTGDSYARLGAPAGASIAADIATTNSRLTSARAGYLDNLNVGGNVASSAEVVGIQNNTRVVRVVPDVFERPDSGSTAFRIELLIYDEVGNMEAPDSAPTISVVNQAGTSRDANLDSTTMSLVSVGRYRSTYTIDTNHAIEELIFAFTVVEGGATRIYANPAQVVDTTAVDFTTSDRTALTAIKTQTDLLAFTSGKVNAQVKAVDTDAINAAALAADAVTEMQSGLATAAAIAALNNLSSAQVQSAVLAMVVEGSLTFQQVQEIMLAALAGKADGAGGTTMHFRNQADSKNRITATVDADGNRSAVTLDLT